MDLPKPPRRWHDGDRFALFVGAVYGALGVGWILGSDALVKAISSDPEWLRQAQRYKGLVYVWLTALALVLLVRVGYRQLLAARERARQSDLRVQDLFMQHPMPMWVFDLGNYRFLRVNDAALAAYGYTRAEFEAMTALDIRPPEEAAAFLSAARAPRRTALARCVPAPYQGRRGDRRAHHRARAGTRWPPGHDGDGRERDRRDPAAATHAAAAGGVPAIARQPGRGAVDEHA